jgi:hypothetical protein
VPLLHPFHVVEEGLSPIIYEIRTNVKFDDEFHLKDCEIRRATVQQ